MGELSIKNSDALDIIKDKGLSDVIKPLKTEIHLFDSFVAGTSYVEDKEVFNTLKIGDELMLFREDNKFDEKAIKITNTKKDKLGYIPEKDNAIFSRLLDAGKHLKAKVKNIENKNSFNKISIGIYFVDF